MLINVDNKSNWFRAHQSICDSLKIPAPVEDAFEKVKDYDLYPFVVREVTNMFPDGCTTLRRFNDLEDANALRYRAMLHASHFLGFDPYHPPLHQSGWAAAFPLPDWRELEYCWEKMFADKL